MGKIISLASLKGGVGKTTTAINLSVALGKSGKKILLIDLDPIANCTSGLVMHHNNNATITQVINKEVSVSEAIIKSVSDNVDLIPSNMDLTNWLIDQQEGSIDLQSLKEVVDSVESQYDFVFMDCSPSWGRLNLMSFIAANSIIIPVQTEYFALDSISQLLTLIRNVQKKHNPNIKIEGILLTMLDKRLTHCTNVVMELNRTFVDNVYDVIVPKDTTVVKSQIAHKSVIDFMPWKPASIAYSELGKEFLKRVIKTEKNKKVNAN